MDIGRRKWQKSKVYVNVNPKYSEWKADSCQSVCWCFKVSVTERVEHSGMYILYLSNLSMHFVCCIFFVSFDLYSKFITAQTPIKIRLVSALFCCAWLSISWQGWHMLGPGQWLADSDKRIIISTRPERENRRMGRYHFLALSELKEC